MTYRQIFAFAISGALALGTTVAQAHPRLLTSTPAANATINRATAIQLTFSEKLIGSMTGADVMMTGMATMAHHRPVKMNGFVAAREQDGKSLRIFRSRPLPTGLYMVVWHAVAIDTHRVSGNFAFRVK